MKIICVGRNFPDHITELNSDFPKNPVFFLKPESSLLRTGKPFYIPAFSNDIHYELEVVLRIHKLGKHIHERFALRYFDRISLGIDFTARDLQNICKQKGLPWEISKSFDNSAAIGEFINLDKIEDIENFNFCLKKNGNIVQNANVSEMIFSFSKIISYVSKFMTLKIGDLIYTGTPAGVGNVVQGDRLIGELNGCKLLDIEIK